MNLVEVPTYKVDGVVVGMDRQFDFKKMSNAMRCILNGASFYGTNPDPSFPAEDGLMTGCGAILDSIKVSSGAKPRIFGKPYPESLQFLLEITGFEKEETVIIGDRLDTDIKLAKAFGVFSILVLTGVSKREDLSRFDVQPDMVVENLSILEEFFNSDREVK
jgi:4-nitrophenyl phosphatase